MWETMHSYIAISKYWPFPVCLRGSNAKTMAKAQKVFLLLQSAQSAVEIASTDVNNTGYYKDILAKYNKAKEICDNSCGCDC